VNGKVCGGKKVEIDVGQRWAKARGFQALYEGEEEVV